ncbi:MAG: N-acetylmuramoyl-L-alanine amidase [Thermoanaerobaculales bacterium]|nr:N-acetylmuramoyl-L-alanine amidase [Thermoanaerobaculales bacterium]
MKRKRATHTPPKKVDRRFRKKLLQGAIDENLDLLADRPLGSTTKDRERQRRRIRRWLFGSAMAGLVLIGTSIVLTMRPTLATGEAVPNSGSFRLISSPAYQIDVNDPDPALPSLEGAILIAEAIPLTIRTVVIDPGHGGRDGGTSLNFGLLEKDLTLDIGIRLARRLEEAGLSPILTRSQDVEISLPERVAVANIERADLFISIHINWLPDRSARGVETYYLGPSDDPFLNRLAASENRASGFTLADTRRLLEVIYADVRREESRRLARSVQDSLFEVLRTENPDIVSRGVMSAPFAVLVATEMPAILAEVACLSNDREARLLAIPAYRQKIADALAEGVFRFATQKERNSLARTSHRVSSRDHKDGAQRGFLTDEATSRTQRHVAGDES